LALEQIRQRKALPRPKSNIDTVIEGLAARQAAIALLSAVIDHRQGLDQLSEAASAPPSFRALEPRDKALALAITKSALRHRGAISAVLSPMLERPLPERAKNVMHILHAALAQIFLLRVPQSAAVNLAVEAARADPQAQRFAPLVNAILRRIEREREAAEAVLQSPIANVPDWLNEALTVDYGVDAVAAFSLILREEAPLDLTVKDNPEGWATRLGGVALATGTVRLPHGTIPVPELEGFGEGAWWVQDAASALPARLLGDLKPGSLKGVRIADICAAPGGKTAQLCHAGAEVTALDISETRLKRLSQNLERLQLSAKVRVGDARKFKPDVPFDAVLIDAPCSSTGTMRRHPDVAWTKQPRDILSLSRIQLELIEAAANMLRVGGVIVYANCSLLKDEGERVVARFLAANPDFILEPVTPLRDGEALAAFADAQGCLRTTPNMIPNDNPALQGMDGFFAARLRHRG
jgi:16S rRNA (cytosine967-C5)-methyltransferase